MVISRMHLSLSHIKSSSVGKDKNGAFKKIVQKIMMYLMVDAILREWVFFISKS